MGPFWHPKWKENRIEILVENRDPQKSTKNDPSSKIPGFGNCTIGIQGPLGGRGESISYSNFRSNTPMGRGPANFYMSFWLKKKRKLIIAQSFFALEKEESFCSSAAFVCY